MTNSIANSLAISPKMGIFTPRLSKTKPLSHTLGFLTFFLSVCIVFFLLSAMPSYGAPEPDSATAALPATSEIEHEISILDRNVNLDEASRSRQQEILNRTLKNLQDIASFNARAEEYSRLITQAPQLIASLRKQVDGLAAQTQVPDLSKLNLEEINQRINRNNSEIALLGADVLNLSHKLQETPTNPAEIQTRIKIIYDLLEENKASATSVSASASGSVSSGEILQELSMRERDSRRESLRAELHMLDRRILALPQQETLTRTQLEFTNLRLAKLKQAQMQLEAEQNQRRTALAKDAQQRSEQALSEATNKHPLLRKEIQENTSMAEELSVLTTELGTASTDTKELEEQRVRLDESFRGVRQRLEVVGINKAIGQLMQDQLLVLSDTSALKRRIRDHESSIANATLQQIRYREEQSELRDLRGYINELLAQQTAVETPPEIRKELEKILRERQEVLGQLLSTQSDYIRQLSEFNLTADQIIVTVGDFSNFLKKHLLWVRNASSVDLQTLKDIPPAVSKLMAPQNWLGTLALLWQEFLQSPLSWIAVIFALLIIGNLKTLHRYLVSTAEPLRRIRTDRISTTIKGILISMLLALPLPLMLWTSGYLLVGSSTPTEFSNAVADACLSISMIMFMLILMRILCVQDGIFALHFRWKPVTIQRLSYTLDWFIPISLILGMLSLTIHAYNDPPITTSLGRLLLVVIMIAGSWFLIRLLDPNKGAIHYYLRDNPDGWLGHIRLLLVPFSIIAPLTIAILALAGYIYSAGYLARTFGYQLCVILALVLLYITVVRWLVLTQRQIKFRNKVERQKNRQSNSDDDSSSTSDDVLSEDEKPDLASLDEQTRHLISISFVVVGVILAWLVWRDLIPALGMLDQFTFWHYTGKVNGVEQQIPVTAADIGTVILTIALAVFATRNLPALIEILLLKSSAVSAGGRYAIKTLSGYVITMIAIVLVLSTIGVGWSDIHFILAAVGFTLAFGLRDILANYISGLIILFERPVRVGDMVTISGTQGTITSIKIRATTIRTLDKQELLVPNKQIITEQVLNWTLSDQVTRLSIRVGLEYGQDVRMATNLLMQIANGNAGVLIDPEPFVRFEQLGDNNPELMLYVYVEGISDRNPTYTSLLQEIYETFAREGIKTATPKRSIIMDK